MGFDLGVQRLRNGKMAPYPRKIAEDIVDRGALAPSKFQQVEYLDGGGEIYCGGSDFSGLMPSHFGGHTICERVLEIAAVTQSLIFWPSTNIFLGVTDMAFLDHAPQDLREKEYIALVRNVDELWAAINA